MFDYIYGRLTEATAEYAVLDVNGIGYEIGIPASSFSRLPAVGEMVKLFTYYHVREDIQKLYGFLTKLERLVFKKIITVNMVGPKLGISILSDLPVADIITAIEKSDVARFKSVSGVGPKTAQRIILELKGKVSFELLRESHMQVLESQAPVSQIHGSIRDDAYEALRSLGYSDTQALHAVQSVERILGTDATVEQWIKMALKGLK